MNRCIAILCALALAGCVETKDEYILNPDGTGKVQHQALFAPVDLSLDESKAAVSPAEELKNAIRQELEKAEGIEAWPEASYERTAEGKIRFRATAYFRDLGRLKFHNNGFKDDMLKPTWSKGLLELGADKDQPAAKNPPPAPATEAEIASALAKARVEYQRMKPVLGSMLGSVTTEMRFRLPGTVTDSSNLQKLPDGALQITFQGKQMLAVMDKFMADEARLRAQIQAGKNPLKDGPRSEAAFNATLFGEAKPIRAVVQLAARPQFDYAAEVAAARAGQAAIYKALGSAVPTPVAPATSAQLKNLTVGGVRWIRVSDDQRGIRPFNWTPGYSLALIAELPGAVLKVREGRLLKAEADNGTDLLPAKDWDRKIHFVHLSKDQTAATFELRLAVPGTGVNGFKEISGELTYLVGHQTKQVDLGFAELKEGAAGQELAARIKSIKPSSFRKGMTELTVLLGAKRETIKQLVLLGADGQPLDLEESSYSSFDSQTTIAVRVQGLVPSQGKLRVELYDRLQEFTAPFQLRDLTLLGTPAQ